MDPFKYMFCLLSIFLSTLISTQSAANEYPPGNGATNCDVIGNTQEASGATYPECGEVYHIGDFATNPGVEPDSDSNSGDLSDSGSLYTNKMDQNIDIYDVMMLQDYLTTQMPIQCWQSIVMDTNSDGVVNIYDLQVLLDIISRAAHPNNIVNDYNHVIFNDQTFIGDANDDGHVIVNLDQPDDANQTGTGDPHLGQPLENDIGVIFDYLVGVSQLSPAGYNNADYNRDGIVDYSDLVSIATCYQAESIPVLPPDRIYPDGELTDSQGLSG